MDFVWREVVDCVSYKAAAEDKDEDEEKKRQCR